MNDEQASKLFEALKSTILAVDELSKRPSARAEPRAPKVSIEDLTRSFEADGGELTDAERELLDRAMTGAKR